MFFPYFYLLMFYQCGTVFQTAFLTTCYNTRDFVPGYSRFARYWLPAKSYGYWSSLNKTSI